MVQLDFDPRRLIELERMLGLSNPRQRVSLEYLIHSALGELFQAQAPRPFSVESTERASPFVRVLGYSSVDATVLHELARGFASPALYQTCVWSRLASKPMPEDFPAGIRLRFDVRVCPVVRKSSESPKWSKGQEIDAFLSHVWELGDPDIQASRGDIYRTWLEGQFTSRGGAAVVDASMVRFEIARMTRRTQGEHRIAHTIQRPDVSFSGILRVTEGTLFSALLRDGIGRHRSFGFGMLKVRRA